MADVVQTPSPSMDIQVSSNFERLLFDLYDEDGSSVAALMSQLKQKHAFTLSPEAHARLKETFDAAAVSNGETLATIREVHKKFSYVLDPHTAVGVAAGEKLRAYSTAPLVVLATAHPAKFPEAVKQATSTHPALPAHVSGLLRRTERFDVLENSVAAVQAYIESHAA